MFARSAFFAISVTAAGAAGQACAACAPADPSAVGSAIRSLFTALSDNDQTKLSALLSPGFYAYDGGKRFDGMALPKLIAEAKAAGKTYVWTVNDPEAHITCNDAWIAYVNRGSVTDSKGTTPLTWLESANLRFEDGRWRILFLHSTRAAQP